MGHAITLSRSTARTNRSTVHGIGQYLFGAG